MADVPPHVPFLAPSPSAAPPAPRCGDLDVERCDVADAAVLRLRGDLTQPAMPTVLLAVQHEFASHARPVVCDLSQLRSLSPSAAGVFATAVAGCGGWPVVELALAAPSPAVARQLRTSGAARFVAVQSTVALAVRAAATGPSVLREVTVLDRSTALLEGRRFVVDCCLRWRAAEHTAAAEGALPLVRAALARTAASVELQVTYNRRSVVLRALLPPGGTGPVPADMRIRFAPDGREVLSTALA